MELVNRLRNSVLVKDNLVLFLGMVGVNLMGFIFHFYAGRVLGPSDYGVLGVVLAVFYYFTILIFAIQSSVAKFTSDFHSSSESGCVAFLFRHSLRKLFLYSLLITFAFLLFVPWLSSFVKIDNTYLYLLSFVIVFAFLYPVIRGVLQGLQKFSQLSAVFWIEGFTKIILVYVLLNFGLGVSGALIAMIFAWVVPLFFGFYCLKKYFNLKESSFKVKSVYSYTVPMLIMMLMLTAFYTLDVIMIKHYFSSFDAGLYAALALLGKALFWGSISISQVMFPKVVENKSRKVDSRGLLFKSMLIVIGLVSPIIILYYAFPSFIVNLLYGADYVALGSLLGPFAIFMALFSLVYLLSFYNIALKRYGFIVLLAVFAILEVVLIYLYHSSLAQIVNLLILVMFILFVIMLIYSLRK